MSHFGDKSSMMNLGKKHAFVTMQDNDKEDGGVPEDDFSTVTATKTKPKRPSLYRVLLLNDDYTPMEFVIHVLENFFHKDR